MHPQLETLLQLQDLKTQRRELLEGEEHRSVEEEEFGIDVDEAVEKLDAKIDEVEEDLESGVRRRYERIAKGQGRFVAPVINGTCYGCFVSTPTAHIAEIAQNNEIRHCENCGRFLYVVGNRV